MDKTKATELIKKQMNALSRLQHSNAGDEDFKKWHRDTRVIIDNIFGCEAKHGKEFLDISFTPNIYTEDEERQINLNYKAFHGGITSARAFFNSLIYEIDKFWNHETSTDVSLDSLKYILRIFDRFRGIARQIQSRHDDRNTITIGDEYDVQDLLHVLLKIYFDDIRTEEWTPSYAGGSSRMDFLLKNEKIVIEVKKTRDGLKDKEVGKQLIEDKAKYKQHPDCKKLMCFVYDPEGFIGNPASLENDLSETSDVFEVRVVIRPKD